MSFAKLAAEFDALIFNIEYRTLEMHSLSQICLVNRSGELASSFEPPIQTQSLNLSYLLSF